MIKVIFYLSFFTSLQAVAAERCHYETWDWNATLHKSVNHLQIDKARSELSAEEVGRVPGCTVCREDQQLLRIKNLPEVWVCKKLIEKFRRALEAAAPYELHSLVGYRVGKSRGDLNAQGLRTVFSNHSYGTAIDVNSESNGLYGNCPHFGSACKLMRGGVYDPQLPNAITPATYLYQAMRAQGFRWGGELVGQQKDFMHFSLSGD